MMRADDAGVIFLSLTSG